MTTDKPVYIVQHNHFDPIWRRCWDRTFDYNGMRLRSYTELEERVFNTWLESAKQGATFSEGQAVVVRQYLERNPQRLAEMKELVKQGIMELLACGESVPDTNMPGGESLLRNLILGQRWFEDTFGVVPRIGSLEDAFGQSAQLPQMFRGCGVRHVLFRSYRNVPGPWWKGLDGSVVCVADTWGRAHAWGQGKIPPCPDCGGYGCPECEASGFARQGWVTDENLNKALHAELEGEPCVVITIGDEESLPNPKIVQLVAEAKAEPGAPDLRFGTYEQACEHFAQLRAGVDDPELETSEQVEANPVSTGCYVTRIRIKQLYRELEHALVCAEKWATVAWLAGDQYPREELTKAWRDLVFGAFHDAITSTHVDAAYDELLDMFTSVREAIETVQCQSLGYLETGLPPTPAPHQRLVIYNAESWTRKDPVTAIIPRGLGAPLLTTIDSNVIRPLNWENTPEGCRVTFLPPPVPPLGYETLMVSYHSADTKTRRSGAGEVDNGVFRLRVSTQGIVGIDDLRTGQPLVNTDTWMANELLLEEDIGHPWGTSQVPGFCERLSTWTREVLIEEGENTCAIKIRGRYAGRDVHVRQLSWEQEARLYEGVPRIEFRTRVSWDTRDRRLRVVMPSMFDTNRGTWSIPYGALERGPYEPNYRIYPSTNGDWPAINWLAVGDGEHGLALLNRGLPSHKVEAGNIFLSLLRSPTQSWCLNEPEFYDCPDFVGARDRGTHVFEYALVSYKGDWRTAGIERLGREYNTPMIARMTECCGDGSRAGRQGFMQVSGDDNVIVTAIKAADRIDGVVVRVAETDGQSGRIQLQLEGATPQAELVNFIEAEPRPVGQWPLELPGFRVATLQFAREEQG